MNDCRLDDDCGAQTSEGTKAEKLSRACTGACRRVLFEVRSQTMLDWSQCSAVERVPGKVSGAWIFKGTRVPVRALFENVEDGATVNDFLAWFPGVIREQVEAVLEHAERSLAVA
jgi:uncharacterized protein (DUF433 family)